MEAMNDIINGMFELLATPFILFSLVKLYREKVVRGVSFVHVAFFAGWGIWNLYYYPSLGQWASFVGGIGVAVTNVTYALMLVYYSLTERVVNEK